MKRANETNRRFRDDRGLDVTLYDAAPDKSATWNSDAFEAALADIEALSEDNYGTTLFVPFGTFQLARTLHLRRGMILQGVSGLTFGGTRLVFAADTSGIEVHYPIEAGDGHAAHSSIRDLVLEGSGSRGHGVDMHARAHLDHVLVDGFGGNGVNITADTNSRTGNANGWSLTRTRVVKCGGHGVYTDGGDSNAGSALLVDCSENGGWGIYDSSFLGNTYIACHVAANGAGAYKTDDRNARNVLLNCYSEGDQPPSEIETTTIVLGGLHSAGFTTTDVASLAASVDGAFRIRNKFRVEGNFGHDGDRAGFYGTAPIARPTVAGSTDTAKIDSLIAALASLGLIADSTT